jgi:hypothetical protein
MKLSDRFQVDEAEKELTDLVARLSNPRSYV